MKEKLREKSYHNSTQRCVLCGEPIQFDDYDGWVHCDELQDVCQEATPE
jgi:hypothetical protein